MLKKKEVADYIDAKRLGVTFEEDRIIELYKNLSEAGLPVIPYDATVDELNRLLENIAGHYAYLQDGFALLRIEERKRERSRQRAYTKAYLEADKRVAGANQAVLKMIAESTKEVEEADDALDEIRNRIDAADCRIKALGVLDQDVRKLINSCRQLPTA